MIKRHIIRARKLTEDRYSGGMNMPLYCNADATVVRSAAEECVQMGIKLVSAIAAAGVCAAQLVCRHEDCDSSWGRGSGSISRHPWWAGDRHVEVMQEARYSGQPEWVGCGSQNQTGASEENLPLCRRKRRIPAIVATLATDGWDGIGFNGRWCGLAG